MHPADGRIPSQAFPFINRPTVLGHEIAGVVVEAGDAAPLKVGDRVVSLHWASCGSCEACLDGRTTHCSSGWDSFLALTTDGGYAEYVRTGASAFVPVPDGWSAVDAASVNCTYGTVYHGAFTRGRLRAGERVLVTGASGGVGTAMVQLAKAMHCEVIAVTSSPDKVDALLALGADEVIVHAKDTPFHKDACIGEGVDMAFEAVGEPTFLSSMHSLKRGGRLVLIGNVTAGKITMPLGATIVKGLEIIGSDSCSPGELKAVFALMDKVGIRPIIAKTMGLEGAAEAHDILERQGVSGGRIILKVGDEW